MNFLKGIHKLLVWLLLFVQIRSLINGKMSLTEIEGLSDLLEAETTLQLKIYQQNASVFKNSIRCFLIFFIKGKIDKCIKIWQDEILNILAEIEAKIEFSESEHLSGFSSKTILTGFEL